MKTVNCIDEKIENESDFLMRTCAGTLQTKSGHCGVSLTKQGIKCKCREYCEKEGTYICSYDVHKKNYVIFNENFNENTNLIN